MQPHNFAALFPTSLGSIVIVANKERVHHTGATFTPVLVSSSQFPLVALDLFM